jgi:hypothetical protein
MFCILFCVLFNKFCLLYYKLRILCIFLYILVHIVFILFWILCILSRMHLCILFTFNAYLIAYLIAYFFAYPTYRIRYVFCKHALLRNNHKSSAIRCCPLANSSLRSSLRVCLELSKIYFCCTCGVYLSLSILLHLFLL